MFLIIHRSCPGDGAGSATFIIEAGVDLPCLVPQIHHGISAPPDEGDLYTIEPAVFGDLGGADQYISDCLGWNDSKTVNILPGLWQVLA